MSNIDISLDGKIARLKLRRPEKRNAMTAEMWDDIASGLTELSDSGARALAIEGAAGAFSAGADLASVTDADGSRSEAYHERLLDGLAAIREFPRPTLAVIDGPCIGAGCSIALACDVRFASPGAIFGVPAVRYGFVFEEWSLTRLVQLVGSGHASCFLFSGTTISGARAAEIGLVELCGDDVTGDAERYLLDVVSGEPATMSATRELIRRVAGPDVARRR